MTTIALSRLLQGVTPTPLSEDVTVSGLALDSRLVKPGDVFFACQGTSKDGRHFIQEAIQKGAKVVLIEGEEAPVSNTVKMISIPNLKQQISEIAARFYHHPAESLRMIGITGTNGKTSCSHFIGNVLQQLNKPCGIIGTLGNGLYGDLTPSALTTPDPITLQKTLAEWVKLGVKNVAMEVSSHSLDQDRVKGIPFAVGIFTNLTREHLDYHGTMEAYFAAKWKLFNNALTKRAVVNVDDPFGETIIDRLKTKNTLYTYGLKGSNEGSHHIIANEVRLTLDGIQADIVTPWGIGLLKAPLVGQFNVSNLLAVLTTLCLLDIPFDQVLDGLAKVKPVPGRMETLGGNNKPLVVVDYSHTPDSLEKALKALRLHCQGRLFCVFGCGGDRDRGKRPLMAAIAEQHADHIVVTDDNPRHEDPAEIVADILRGFSRPNKAIVQHDRSKAIQDVIQYAKAGDCILIAGKGAETVQLVGDKKIPFSDVLKVREIL